MAQTTPVAIPVPAPASALAIIAPPYPGSTVLRVGTEVPLRLAEDLTTKGKALHVGQRFHMEVAESVMVQGMIAIPVGSPAMGEITDVRNKGMWGKSGHLAGRVLYVMVGGRQIRMSGAFDDKGVAGGIGAVATSAIVFAPAGFFMTGTSAHLASGTPVKGFIDEDVPLSIATQQPAPLAVQQPQPAVPTTVPARSSTRSSTQSTHDQALPSAQY